MWRDLSYNSSLWSSLSLRNVCVNDWNKLALFLERRGTRNIVLKKMVFRIKTSNLEPQITPVNDSQEMDSSEHEISNAACDKIQEPSMSPNKRRKLDGSESPLKREGNLLSPSKDELSISQAETNTSEKLGDKCDDESNEGHRISNKNIDEDNDGYSSDEQPMAIDEGEEVKSENRDQDLKDSETQQNNNMEVETSTDSIDEKIDQKRKHSTDSRSSPEKEANSSVSSLKNKELKMWSHICEALGTVRCLRSVTLPPCSPEVVQLLLSKCNNLTSLKAADVGFYPDERFDPAYLMQAPKLKELRLGSPQGLSFTTNFNFIKLQELKVLVIRGFTGKLWPYLGTNLVSLHLGPCKNFSSVNWGNVSNMKNLKALWLEDGGSLTDQSVYDAISQLTQLRRLCLFRFTVGTKLGFALKKLTRLERLFVYQDSSDGISMGIKNSNMLSVTEHLRFLDELVWAVPSQDIQDISGVDHIHIISPKVKSYPSLSSSENETDQWPVKLIETVIRRHLPMTKIRILKLDHAAAARMALSTL